MWAYNHKFRLLGLPVPGVVVHRFTCSGRYFEWTFLTSTKSCELRGQWNFALKQSNRVPNKVLRKLSFLGEKHCINVVNIIFIFCSGHNLSGLPKLLCLPPLSWVEMPVRQKISLFKWFAHWFNTNSTHRFLTVTTSKDGSFSFATVVILSSEKLVWTSCGIQRDPEIKSSWQNRERNQMYNALHWWSCVSHL